MTALEVAHAVINEIDEGRPDGERVLVLARAVIAMRDEVENFAANWKLCEAENDRLRAEVSALRAAVALMRPVVEAAERWADSGSVHDEVVIDAVRKYKAAKP